GRCARARRAAVDHGVPASARGPVVHGPARDGATPGGGGLVNAALASRVVGMRGPVGLLARDRPPRARIDAAGHRLHGDAVLDRAHADAQVATHALCVDHFEVARAVLRRGDGLVRGVLAGDVAAAALDAQVLVDVRLVDVVEVQVLPVGDAG